MTEEILNQGIQAAQAGDRKRAQYLLIQAVQQTPQSAQAWHWLGMVLDDPEKKKYCLDRAMQLDPSLAEDAARAVPAGSVPAVSAPTVQQAVEPASAAVPQADPPPAPPEARLPRRAGKIPTAVLAGAAVLLLFVAAAALLFFALDPARLMGRAAPTQASALLPAATRRVMPTLIPTRTPSPVHTRTPTPTPSHTPVLNPTQLYHHLGLQVTAARAMLDSGAYIECVQAYDRLLESMPEWPIGYYNRGLCKRNAASDIRYLSEYEDQQRSAIDDQDTSILLDPAYSNAYVERAYNYLNLIETLDSTAEQQMALNIALENIEAALALNPTSTYARINRALIPIRMGRCREGLQYGYQQKDTMPAEQQPVLDMVLSIGHLCLGEYADGQAAIEKSLKTKRGSDYVRVQTANLIGAKKYNEAYQAIDKIIQENPTFGGYRYYLRALILFDQGDFERARQDLNLGYRYTWYHGGLHAYLAGMLALEDGDEPGAVEWLVFAADSAQPNEGLWLRQRIQAELSRLGVQHTEPTPAIHWNVTPIPAQFLTPAAASQ